MGYLDANRVLDPDDGEQFVIAHKDLEVALSEIFGIPLERRITQSILGTVAADGSFTLIRLKSKPGVQAADAVGVEFTDGHITKRILYVDSRIKVYSKAGQAWEQVHDFESEDNPDLTDLEDVDKTQVELSDANKNKIVYTVLGTNNQGVLFGLAKNEIASDGAKSFFELDEVGSEWTVRVPGSYCKITDDAGSLIPQQPEYSDPYGSAVWWAGRRVAMQIVSAQNTTAPWVVCGPWAGNGSNAGQSLATIGGQGGAGVYVPRGLYTVNLSANISYSFNLKGSIRWGLLCPGCSKFPSSTQYMTKGMPFYLKPPVAGSTDYIYPITGLSVSSSVKVDLGTHMVAVPTGGRYIGAQIWQNTPSHIIADLTFTIVGIK